MANLTDYLQTTQGGALIPFVGVWVRLVSNTTGTAYVSQAATNASGMFTIAALPTDFYTVYSGPSTTGPWTATGDATLPQSGGR